MDYEIVYVEEKSVAGLKIRTSNNHPSMGREIGELWQGFFEKGVYQSIPNKQNDKTIGLYTNYESDANGAYDMMVCCEILSNSSLPIGLHVKTIPGGKYAKFVVQGDVQKAVGEFWGKLWSMDLDRKFSFDFEEYQSGSDMKNAEIHIYISLK
ncbi:GyrI-like domain-containing protein [Bacillus sp. 03113]|uniref:GyrI-like domain-containing protein n=1 Tax=Bacillus sp. 03113 TaxID=2578211 RepID=UPI001143A289|nr:GyrI-like domain-containing protein [Bacillus sp. 03113]